MSHFRPYPEYADTQSRFIETIPTHWEIRRLSTLGRLFKGVGGNKQDDTDSGLPCVRYGQLYTVHRYHIRAIDTYIDEMRRQAYMPIRYGDLLLAASGETLDEIGKSAVNLLATDTVCGGDIIVFRPSDELDPTYLGYVADSLPSIGQKALMGKGFTVIHIYGDQLKNLELPLPAKPEQRRIGQYLDQALPRIDTLIEKKTRFIELLKEKRRALITHTVTKGLNPDAPMKDSGIEWLGEVPAHWTTPKLKHVLAEPITDGPHETPIFLDEGIPFVSAEAVGGGFVDFCRIRGFISEEDHARFSKKYRPRAHDIFMVKSGATTGVTAIVDSDIEFNIWSPLAAMRCSEKVAPKFLLYFLRSIPFQDAIALSWSFGTQQNIGMGVLGNMSVVLPPPGEQLKILAFLAMQCGKTEHLLSKTGHSIALLQERRSALITAAVTGKIDLRDAA